MTAPPLIFDRRRVGRARARRAARFSEHDFLHRRAMADIIDRLETVTRTFDSALFVGAGALARLLTPKCGVGAIIEGDLAAGRLDRLFPGVAMDEERSPFASHSFDLIVSLLTLHSTNDLIGALAQHLGALKPGGLFLGAMFGEETLRALKNILLRAEMETAGGAASRFPPFAEVRALGGALQRAGFQLPVVDVDNVDIHYADMRRLIDDFRAMGETGILTGELRLMARTAACRARDLFAAAGGALRVDIVYLTGWAPHPDQPKPLKPGSAKASLEEAINKSGR